MPNRYFRVTYSYQYTPKINSQTTQPTRGNGKLFIIASSRPPFDDMEKIVERKGDNPSDAKDFLVLAAQEVAAGEVKVDQVIINYDDEAVEES